MMLQFFINYLKIDFIDINLLKQLEMGYFYTIKITLLLFSANKPKTRLSELWHWVNRILFIKTVLNKIHIPLD